MFFYIKIYAIINQKLINQKSLCILREYKSFRQLSRLADFVDSLKYNFFVHEKLNNLRTFLYTFMEVLQGKQLRNLKNKFSPIFETSLNKLYLKRV